MLLDKALQSSTQKTYQRAMSIYDRFCSETYHSGRIFPASTHQVILFIAYCYSNDMAVSTVSTYVAALGYFHKLENQNDPTQNFVVKKCLHGFKNAKGSADMRMPITPSLLNNLVSSLPHVSNSYFTRTLLQAMYLLAFHAFLRVGEFTSSSSRLQVQDIRFCNESGNLDGVEIHFRTFKHSKYARTLLVSCCNHDINQCPVHSLQQYFQLRQPTEGPLFTFLDGAAVSRSYFTRHLQMSLKWSNVSSSHYKGHSFRIGAATTAAAMGIPDDTIQLMGRWSSCAFKKYIRIPVLKL